MKRNILLNPGPATTTQSVKDAMVVPDICPRETEFGDLLRGIQEDLVKVVHGEGRYIATLFAASGTGGMEATVASAIPKDGKLLVVENGAYGTRMIKIAETFNIPLTAYKLPYGGYPDLNEFENILKADPAITHIGLTHHETTTGILNPIQELCDISNKHGKSTIVDAMSSYAGLPINIKKWDADYLISSSNKCIQGMAGMTFVIFKSELLEIIKPNKRSYYFDIYSQYTGFENSGQMQFTPPVQVAYALRQAIDEYFAETEMGRYNRYAGNWNLLYDGLQKLGFKFLLPKEQESEILLAILEPSHPAFSFNEMHDFLYEKGFTIYPGKGATQATFRLSVLGDLHLADISAFLAELGNYLYTKNIDPLYH